MQTFEQNLCYFELTGDKYVGGRANVRTKSLSRVPFSAEINDGLRSDLDVRDYQGRG